VRGGGPSLQRRFYRGRGSLEGLYGGKHLNGGGGSKKMLKARNHDARGRERRRLKRCTTGKVWKKKRDARAIPG